MEKVLVNDTDITHVQKNYVLQLNYIFNIFYFLTFFVIIFICQQYVRNAHFYRFLRKCKQCIVKRVHTVAQLVEALRYKSERRGFDSGWCDWNFSLT
jgi:hypothetical protein